jgi:hypothetical protein
MAVLLTAVNLTALPIVLSDIGKTVPALGSVVLTDDLRLSEIHSSIDLQDAIIAGQIVLSDGTGNLSKAQSLATQSGLMASGVQVTGEDTAPSNLNAKFAVGIGLSKSTLSPGGDEQLRVSAMTAPAVAVGTANAEGVAVSLARADHTHQVTGLALPGQAQGDILYFDGTVWVRLGASAEGYRLQTNGPGANPGWSPGSVAIAAFDSAGGIAFTTAPVTVKVDSVVVADTVFYSLASGQIEVLVDGRYRVDYQCSVRGSTASRSQAEAWLDNGGEVKGTRSTMYCRQANHGATGAGTVVLDLSAGDALSIRAVRTQGAGVLVTMGLGSRLSIVRLS